METVSRPAASIKLEAPPGRAMSTRALLLLFSFLMIVGAATAAVWLLISHQAVTFDGLFLTVVCLVVILAFGLYARFLIRDALRELSTATRPTPVRERGVEHKTPQEISVAR